LLFYRLSERPWESWGRVQFQRARRILYPVAVVLAILALIWLLATLAKAQPGHWVINAPQRAEPALYDTAISLTPNDPNSDSYNRVAVGLTFYGASDFPGGAVPQEVGIDHGYNDRFEIQDATVKPNTLRTTQSRYELRAQVPTTYARELRRLRGMAEVGYHEFRKTNDYQDTLRGASLTEIHYQLIGAQISRAFTNWSWLHRFPFDEFDIRFPARFSKPVMLSKIDLARVPSEYYADPAIAGLAVLKRRRWKSVSRRRPGWRLSMDDNAGRKH